MIDENGNLIAEGFQEAARGAPVAQSALLLPFAGDPRKAPAAIIAAWFTAWWDWHVWIKRGKGAARKAYERVVRSGAATPEQLGAAADAYALWHKRNRSRQPIYPARWLDEERWGDDQTFGDAMSPEQQRSAAFDWAARNVKPRPRSSFADEYWSERAAKQRAARCADDPAAEARAEERAQQRRSG